MIDVLDKLQEASIPINKCKGVVSRSNGQDLKRKKANNMCAPMRGTL